MIRFLVLFTALAFLAAPSALGQELDQIRVGHWARVKGALDDDGRWIADELEIREAENDEELIGTITEILDAERFVLLGQEVHLDEETKFDGLDRGDLLGARVKVTGDWKGPRKFSADEIDLRDPGRDRIEGRIDELELLSNGDLRLSIMIFDVLVPRDATFEQETPLGDIETIEPRVAPKDDELEYRDDDDDLRGSIRLADNLTLGGQLEYRNRFEDDYNLDDQNAEDRAEHQFAFRAELVYQPLRDAFFLAGFRHQWRMRNDEDAPRREDTTTVLNEAYAYWRNVKDLGFDLQVGRQDFDDEREWLYDQNLDGVRLIVDRPAWRGEFSYTTTLSNGSPRDESSRNWIAYVSNNDDDVHYAAYWIDRNDRSDSGGHPVHFGARALGEVFADHQSWAEVAVLRGESRGRANSGYGFDVGTTWIPNGRDGWNYTVGLALGSGDTATVGTNGTFEQTGLQDNNSRFLGTTSFRYYGELVDPELSNLSVLTLGIGRRIAKRNSIDLVLHKYDQVKAFNRLRDTDLDEDPDGVHKDLGWELDFVFGSSAIENWALEIVLGAFLPGDAFPGSDPAYLARFQLRYLF